MSISPRQLDEHSEASTARSAISAALFAPHAAKPSSKTSSPDGGEGYRK
jgi:hypothetical protein